MFSDITLTKLCVLRLQGSTLTRDLYQPDLGFDTVVMQRFRAYLEETKLVDTFRRLITLLLDRPELPYNPYPGFVQRFRQNAEVWVLTRSRLELLMLQFLFLCLPYFYGVPFYYLFYFFFIFKIQLWTSIISTQLFLVSNIPGYFCIAKICVFWINQKIWFLDSKFWISIIRFWMILKINNDVLISKIME